MTTFYVYQLIDPRTNKPFYVGKGCGNRATAHIAEARGSKAKWINRIKCQIILNIELCGLEVVIDKLSDGLSESEAFDMEEQLIARMGRLVDGSGILSNIAKGGVGGNAGIGTRSVQSYTESGALLESFPSLLTAADKHKVHISTICSALNGRSSKAAGVRWGYDGEPLSPYTNGTKSPVSQFAYDGSYITDYPTVTAASASSGVGATSIVGCCRHTGYVAGGYRWAYTGEYPQPLPPTHVNVSGNRVLRSFDSEGVLVGIYSGPNEGASKTKANATGISDCCAGRKQTSGSLRWEWWYC